MIVSLLTEHHLDLLSLKGSCRGSSESTLVKMPHCWKSHVISFSEVGEDLDMESRVQISSPMIHLNFRYLSVLCCVFCVFLFVLFFFFFFFVVYVCFFVSFFFLFFCCCFFFFFFFFFGGGGVISASTQYFGTYRR